MHQILAPLAPSAGGRPTSWVELADRVHRLAARASATVGAAGTRVVAVDGFSGSGKTWFAERLGRALDAPVLHVDDFVPGWHGLDEGIAALGRDLVTPWSHGRTGTPLTYDWGTGSAGPRLDLPAPEVAVLEGSGIASLASGSGVSVRIWVHAAPAVRARRLDARADRVEYLPFRAVWSRQEEDLAGRHATRRRADLRVVRADATGAHLGALPPPSRTPSRTSTRTSSSPDPA